MATLHQYLAENHSIGQEWSHTDKKILLVTEVCSADDGEISKRFNQTSGLSQDELKLRLSERVPSLNLKGARYTVLLRVFWIVKLVEKQQYDITSELFDLIHHQVGHTTLWRAGSSCLAGIERVDEATENASKYFMSFQTKISMTWTTCKTSGCTTVICIAEEAKVRLLEDLLSQEFVHRLADHALCPALVVATMLYMEIDRTQEKLKQDIRRVEVRTGHHDWKTRIEAPELGDLTDIAAKMSGCSTRSASCVRKQHTLANILEFIFNQHAQEPSDNKAIISTAAALRTRVAAQQIDMEFIRHRNQTQIEALSHLVAQNDVFSAQEMAQDTKLLALAAQRDSSSMKAIAVLTMFFLPGTFVSSLLSIPLFAWNAGSAEDIFRSDYSKPVLVTFVIITLPLTALVFAIWGCWILWQTSGERRKKTTALKQLNAQLAANEVRLLSHRRRTLSGS